MDPRDFCVRKSEYLIQRPWLTARRDELLLPNGHVVPEYYVLEYPDWVNVIAVTAQGKMLLTRQYRHALGRILWEIPCGVLEKTDASPLEGAKRELQEETGYGGGQWQELMCISANPATTNNLTTCFLATDVVPMGDPHLDEGECLTVHLKPVDEVRQMVKDGLFLQALHLAPLLKFFAEF